VNEAEGLVCPDPARLLECLRGQERARKPGPFMATCRHRVWRALDEEEYRRQAIEVAERFAEPGRRCVGMAVVKGGSVVITWNDDRVERWTPVGKRYVVEHWFPAAQVPVATPVLGNAERTD
jgi:hypothetical protein